MRAGALITERDVAVLRSLCDYGLLTVKQLRRLHFPSQQTATRRVRRLSRAGLVRCAPVKGHTDRVIVPTPAGLAAGGLDPCRDDVGRLPAALFLRHALAISEFRVALAEGLQPRDGVELVNFVADAERHVPRPGLTPRSPLRAEVTVSDRTVAHAPDAAFALRRGGRLAAFYVEIDMGTEVIGSPERGVGKFMRFYRAALLREAPAWLATALQLERAPDAVRVLVVTTSHARVQSIRRVCGGAAAPHPMTGRIWIAATSILTDTDVLGSVWLSLDPQDDRRQALVTEGEAKQ